MADTYPDFSDIIDLRQYDLVAQRVFDLGLANLKASMPTWEPREGHTEVVSMEAWAQMIEELGFLVNRLLDSLISGVVTLHGVTRDPGWVATTFVTFALDPGTVVPVGTELVLNATRDGRVPYTQRFMTLQEASESALTVGAMAISVGAGLNGIASGRRMECSFAGVRSVTTDAEIIGGVDPETDERYRLRATQRFGRVSSSCSRARDLALWALGRPEIGRARAVEFWDGSTETGGDTPGKITLAAYGRSGHLTDPLRSALLTAAGSVCTIAVRPTVLNGPTFDASLPDGASCLIKAIDVTASVRRTAVYTDGEVQRACEAAIAKLFNPLTSPWGTPIDVSDIVTALGNVPGVDAVDLTEPSGLTVELNSDNVLAAVTLPTAGVVTITVTT